MAGSVLLTGARTFAGTPDTVDAVTVEVANAGEHLRAAIKSVPGVKRILIGEDEKGNPDIIVFVTSITPEVKAGIPQSYDAVPVVIETGEPFGRFPVLIR